MLLINNSGIHKVIQARSKALLFVRSVLLQDAVNASHWCDSLKTVAICHGLSYKHKVLKTFQGCGVFETGLDLKAVGHRVECDRVFFCVLIHRRIKRTCALMLVFAIL